MEFQLESLKNNFEKNPRNIPVMQPRIIKPCNVMMLLQLTAGLGYIAPSYLWVLWRIRLEKSPHNNLGWQSLRSTWLKRLG